jgi:hypothetical protein
MTEEVESSCVVKFTRKNFAVWHFQMELVLKAKELLKVVNKTWRLIHYQSMEEEESWRKKNSAARYLISMGVN